MGCPIAKEYLYEKIGILKGARNYPQSFFKAQRKYFNNNWVDSGRSKEAHDDYKVASESLRLAPIRCQGLREVF